MKISTQPHNDLDVGSDYIVNCGFNIDCLIDVGVHEGTPALYTAFKDCKIIAIDPRKECLEFVQKWAKAGYDIEFQNVGLGARDELLTLDILKGPGGSSFLSRNNFDYSINPIIEKREVQIARLDDVILRFEEFESYGLKIDVEGFELEVIAGASGLLSKCKFVCIEVPLRDNYRTGRRFSDYVGAMATQGFEVVDLWHGKLSLKNSHVDLVFAPASAF